VNRVIVDHRALYRVPNNPALHCRRVVVPGIVPARQKPGSAKGVMLIRIEDDTGVANLILWKDRIGAQRRLAELPRHTARSPNPKSKSVI
jgi:hypothetical protein